MERQTTTRGRTPYGILQARPVSILSCRSNVREQRTCSGTPAGLSTSTISRLKEAWCEEHARWSKRDLSAVSRRRARLLRLSGRALEASAHDGGNDKQCFDLVDDYGNRCTPSPRYVTATAPSKGCLSNKTALAMIFKLAEAAEKNWLPQWSQPVAENHARYKVHRRTRGCQIASSNSCRLIPSVTKIRR
jgi:hypothetical protein